MSIITDQLGYESSKSRIKSSKIKKAVFFTAILFSSLDEHGIKPDTDAFRTEISFEKKMKDILLQR